MLMMDKIITLMNIINYKYVNYLFSDLLVAMIFLIP